MCPQAPGWSLPEFSIEWPTAHVAFCIWLFSLMHLRFVLGSLSVSHIVGWSPCAYISVYRLLPTLKGIWVVYSISWWRRCCCKCSHPGCVSLTLISSQSLRVSRPLGSVWELTYLVLRFFQLPYFSCSHRCAGVGTHQGLTWIFRTSWSILSILWYLCFIFYATIAFWDPGYESVVGDAICHSFSKSTTVT